MNLWRGISRRLTDGPDKRYLEEDYELIPGSDEPLRSAALSHPSPRHQQRKRRSKLRKCVHLWTYGWSLKRVLFIVALLPTLLALGILVWGGVPPSYADIWEFERLLAQHNTTRAMEENRMYLRFPDHLWGHGLNNILQEALLLSYLALESDRTYVFEDYVWSHLPFPWTLYDFSLRPVSLPLNAFISGPTSGSPLPPPYPSKLTAVSASFWETACPPAKRRTLSLENAPVNGEGKEIVDWWIERMRNVKDECVEIESKSNRIFDFDFFGSRILSLYPSLAASPILSQFQWSPLVHSTILRNFPLLQPESPSALYNFSSAGTLTGLVAVHLRRGDYRRHCPRLAGWQAGWNGINEWEELVDKFRPPPAPSANSTAAEEKAYLDYYLLHCWPSQEQIVERLREIRKDNPNLRRAYVSTNGWSWWVNGLKGKLLKDGWEDLRSTLDVEMDAKQKQVGAAVDMAIAERAEVFVGNGFSSLTSNIVMLRMAKGVDVRTNRFL